MMQADAELLRRYGAAAPRYTSYPTVPFWGEAPAADAWVAALATALDADAPGVGASLYVHIPFCSSLCTFCGCNMRVARGHGLTAPYLDSLLAEFALYRAALGRETLPLGELYLGGGTPTFLRAADLDRLLDGLLSHATPQPGGVRTIEADPRNTTREQLQVLARHGFRQISFGIQDFDARVQEIVGRVHAEAQVREVVDAARDAGFAMTSFDLIYGLPLQTADSIEGTLEAVARLRPDRVASYGYTHVPWIKPSQRQFTDADLPDAGQRVLLQALTRQRLRDLGYAEVGLGTWARPDDVLWAAREAGTLHRNFMGYTPQPAAPLVALGTSGLGDAGNAFAQNDKNHQSWDERIKRGELPLSRGHVLDSEDRVLRRHILRLLTVGHTSWGHGEDYVPFLDGVGERLAGPAADGLVTLQPAALTVTPAGRGFLRHLCMAFDARLARARPVAA
jgi:oxygen-independent coproporphyrinogen III oxidase